MPGGGTVAAAYGWLRASHRKLDEARSRPYRPYHAHDEIQKLEPDAPVPVEIEVWPTSVAFEPGDRLVLEVGSRDEPGFFFAHDDPRDRRRGIGLHPHGRPVRLAPAASDRAAALSP
jgi:hypothetical protein